MSDNYSPVLLFVYNRPAHTYNVLNSINKLVEAPYTDLYIFSDGSRDDNEDSYKGVHLVREVLDNFRVESSFKSTTVLCSEHNKGLAMSIIDGVTKIINLYGQVIVLEDDLVVSDDFLRYMNSALAFYRNKPSVWSVSAYTFPMKALKKYCHDIYFSGRACSWGWATWLDRWETIDWEVKDYNKYKRNLIQRFRFSKWGKDMPTMLDSYMYGEIKSWAIRWCYAAFLQRKLTVYPKESRVLNKGTDGSGTNYIKKESRYDTNLTIGSNECHFEMVETNASIRREFSGKFCSDITVWKIHTRRIVKRLISK